MERLYHLEGLRNFRDFGGYAAADGRRVAWQRLFRSGRLGTSTDADKERLSALGARLVVDLRGDQERGRHPNGWMPPGSETVVVPIHQGDLGAKGGLLDRLAAGGFTRADAVIYMVEIYRELIMLCGKQLGDAVRQIAAVEDGGVIVHCMAGKDRTGIVAAMVKLALGVSEADVEADYMISNTHFDVNGQAENFRARIVELGYADPGTEVLMPFCGVDPSYFASAMTAVRDEFGGFDAYARAKEGLGLDEATIQTLRDRYLEPSA